MNNLTLGRGVGGGGGGGVSSTRPRKTEYEIETKETMQREQKVIVLRTKESCMYCVKNKGWVSLVRVRRRCEMQGKRICEHRK